MKPIARLVQLVLDAVAAAKMEAAAKKAAGKVDDAFEQGRKSGEQFRDTLKKIAVALGLAFAVEKVLAFGKAAIEEALKAEKVWNNLAGTVRAAGGSWENMERQVRAAGTAFQDATTHTDEDYAESLSRLISLTGDVSASTANMGLVANVAAQFFGDDLAPAADLVSKVMNGNVMQLQRMGIHVKSAQEGLDVLAQRSFGAATRQMTTFSGQLDRLNNLWGEFKEQIGAVLIEGDNAGGMVTMLRTAVVQLTQWVADHKDELKRFASEAIQVIGTTALVAVHGIARLAFVVGTLGQGFEQGTKARAFADRLVELSIQADIATDALDGLWKKMNDPNRNVTADLHNRLASRYGLTPTPAAADGTPRVSRNAHPTADAEAAAKAAVVALDKARQNYIETLTRQAAAEDALHEPARNLIADLATQQATFGMTADQVTLYKAALAGATPEELAIIQRLLDTNAALEDQARLREKSTASIKEAGMAAKEQMQSLQQELSLTAQLAPLVGEALAAAMTGGLGPFAAGKAQQNLIEAAELGVRAVVSLFNPFTAWQAGPLAVAAAKHLAIAAAWKASSLAFGGGGHHGSVSISAGGGGGGAVAGASGVSSRAAATTAQPAPEIHLHFDGPGFDALNPVVQKVVLGAEQEARARYGNNVKIRIHRSRT